MTMDRRSFLGMGLAAAAVAVPRWGFALPAAAGQADSGDRAAQMRAGAANAPIKTTKLYDNVYLLQGAGGNMAVQTGADGKVLIDSSFSTAVPHLKGALDALGEGPAGALVNTQLDIGHVDGNEGVAPGGVSVFVHAV